MFLRFKSILLISFASFFIFLTPAFSAESTPKGQASNQLITAHIEAAKGTVTIGEPLECRIIVRYKKDVEILSGIDDPEIQGLEIKKKTDWKDREGSFQVSGKTLTLAGYQLGNFIIEPVEISYRIKNGPAQTVKSNPLYITVKSVAEGEEKVDIRDVKGVVKLPYLLLKYAMPIGITLLLAALLAAYLLYFRKRENDKNSRIEKLSPRDQALQDLHELFDSTWIRDGQIKRYYLRFSEILKVYLEKNFGIQASEATTSEIARLLKRIPLADDSKKRLIVVLETADFAKFAKWIPSPTDVIALNKQAEAVVIELSTPPAQPESSHAVS